VSTAEVNLRWRFNPGGAAGGIMGEKAEWGQMGKDERKINRGERLVKR